MSVEYGPSVLEEIRNRAVAGLNAFRHGGLEIGGVLYGVRETGKVRITASSELMSEHAFGPVFALSDNDFTALSKLMEPPPGLETVGWFRSHTRSSVDLDEHDRIFFDRFSDDLRQVALVLKPSPLGSAAAAFFVRTESGAILDNPACEFTLQPWSEANGKESAISVSSLTPEIHSKVTATHVQDLSPSSIQEVSTVSPVSEGLAAAPISLADRRRGFRFWWLWAAAGAILLLGLLPGRPSAPQRLSLVAEAVAPGHVRIAWDRRSLVITDAVSAAVEILDGDSQVTVPLDLNRLHSSSIFYAHRSGNLVIKMQVQHRTPGGKPFEETIRFANSPDFMVAAPSVAPTATDAVDSAQTPPPETDAPEAVTVNASRPSANENSGGNSQPSPAEAVATKPALHIRAAILPSQAVSVQRAPTVPPPPTASGPIQLAHAELLPLPIVLPAPPKPAVYSGPRSGRLIWTGSLGRRGVVEIEGSHASLGSLIGLLPGVPVSFTASPAEFSPGGLRVYRAARDLAGRSEAPSGANGWNATQFLYDPLRASELVVLEEPSPANDFKRVVLRSDARQRSVIVIDWSVR